jgi:hypothetical protein
MKKQLVFFNILIISLLLNAFNGQAQKKQISKDKFLVNVKPKIDFKSFDINTLPANRKADLNQLVKLPNGKQISIKQYADAMNTFEKNLNEIGYSTRTMDKVTLVAEQKLDPVIKIDPNYPAMGTKKTLPELKSVFADETIIPNTKFKVFSLSKVMPQQIQQFKKSSKDKFFGSFKKPQFVALNVYKKVVHIPPVENFSREQSFGPWDVSIPNFGGVKVSASYYLKGKAEPFDGDAADPLEAMKNTNSEFSMGLHSKAQLKIPEIDLTSTIASFVLGGYVNLYSYDADFISRSNRNKKIGGKVTVKFLDRFLISEDREVNGNSLSFNESETYPLNKLLGGMDVFQYGFNFLIPIDVYMGSEVGGMVDVTVDKAGVRGRMGPRLSNAITMEAGAIPFPFSNIFDVGVGGKLDMIANDITFGGNAGISIGEDGSPILNNQAYLNVDVELMKGRIYSFINYPYCSCGLWDCFWEAGNCWGIREVRHTIAKTNGALFKMDRTLVEDDDSKSLDW